MKRGLFAVIEGIDGAGKTSVAKAVVARLNNLGIPALYTYEPNSPELVEFLNKVGPKMGPIFETLLIAADRYYHVESVVKPAIELGKCVISDRYIYSSIAYQGAQGVPREWIMSVNKFVLRPDVTLYLDVPAEIGYLRKIHSDTKVPYLESSKEFLERVRLEYLKLVRDGDMILVDATRPFETVVNDCLNILLDVVRAKTR